MVALTRAQAKSKDDASSNHDTSDSLSMDADAIMTDATSNPEDYDNLDYSSDDYEDNNGLRPWPPTLADTINSARRVREKFARLALQSKTELSSEIAPLCPLDPLSDVRTAGFEFAKTLDSADSAGGVAVLVEEDSFSASRFGKGEGEKSGNVFREWQVLRQREVARPTFDPDGATELKTLGLFASLPGELRNRIYRLVLVMPLPLPLPYPFVMRVKTCALGACVHSRLPTAVEGILSSCRQIRLEAMPIFLAENVGFRFDARVVEARCPAHWIRALGPYARLLRRVVLEVAVYRCAGGMEMHEMVLTCPLGHGWAHGEGMDVQWVQDDRVIEVAIRKAIAEKAEEQCRRVEGHVGELNDQLRVGSVKVEEALRAIVGSDWMADVIWKCRK